MYFTRSFQLSSNLTFVLVTLMALLDAPFWFFSFFWVKYVHQLQEKKSRILSIHHCFANSFANRSQEKMMNFVDLSWGNIHKISRLITRKNREAHLGNLSIGCRIKKITIFFCQTERKTHEFCQSVSKKNREIWPISCEKINCEICQLVVRKNHGIHRSVT